MTIVSLTEPTEFAEKRTLLFKRNRQYEAEGKGHRVWGKQKAVSSRQKKVK